MSSLLRELEKDSIRVVRGDWNVHLGTELRGGKKDILMTVTLTAPLFQALLQKWENVGGFLSSNLVFRVQNCHGRK
jgi:hypothetical protein